MNQPLFRLRHNASPEVKVVYTAISLFFILVLVRGKILHFEWDSAYLLITYFPRAFLSGFYDFSFVLLLTLVFRILLYVSRDKGRHKQFIFYLYVLAALITVIAAILNERTIRIIGSPFNYQWLYYSDFMGSRDSKNAVLSNVSWQLSSIILISCVLVLLLPRLLLLFHNYLTHGKPVRLKRAFVILAIFSVSYSISFSWYKNLRGWQYNQLANPITFFVESVLKTDKSNLLFSMDVPGDFEDLPNTGIPVTRTLNSSSTKIRNVVFFVLESVPAQYMDQYGGKFNVTPEISKLRSNSMLFTNAYAHSPATNNSMVSILGSVYPWISYKSITKEYPQLKLNSITSLLKERKYRTAFYSSGDLKFQRADEFLRHQGFDNIEDFSSKYCREKQFIVKGKRWDNPDGSDDQCMVDAFSEWVDTDDQPFFATLWNVQTHYPYFYSGNEKDYHVESTDFNRYLNALRHADKTLGNLMAALKTRGLEESTLVVIVGDHGEAFGQHQQYTHASKIYEENLHVPLMFVNRNLFSGETNDIIAGQIDIVPTVISLLQLPRDEQWQGFDLFSADKNKRAYFFAPWSDLLFGYREDKFKFIYNATKNITEVYDLEKDPGEKVNIVSQFPGEYVDQGQKRLAKWIQYQDVFMKASIKSSSSSLAKE
ncbi:sulfatase-like hydrolase/transferase [Flavihumibacter sp. R14]|nr:sulfatase-like hydrolase/transferase [Flavihumibacter soli]